MKKFKTIQSTGYTETAGVVCDRIGVTTAREQFMILTKDISIITFGHSFAL